MLGGSKLGFSSRRFCISTPILSSVGICGNAVFSGVIPAHCSACFSKRAAATAKSTSEDIFQVVHNAKTKMVIEMALDFTAMTWLFPKGSTTKIIERLEATFAGFERIRDQKDYDQMHAEFCEWFTQNIDRAQKKKQREKSTTVHKSSYGQAAKVLGIAAKVYVYYCAMPSPEIAEVLIPLLHGAMDNKIVQHLIAKFPETGIKSEKLEDIDSQKYEQLQSLVAKEIVDDFHSEIYPVQYDDIMFRRLNRAVAAAA